MAKRHDAGFSPRNYRAAPSDVVAAELGPVPSEIQSKSAEVKSYGAPVVKATDEAVGLADTYEERGIRSPSTAIMGGHSAGATAHEIDVPTSRNFQHYEETKDRSMDERTVFY